MCNESLHMHMVREELINYGYNVFVYTAVIPHDDEEEEGSSRRNLYGSSFRTFDSRNYSCLATIDVQRSINDLCTGMYVS